MGTSSSLVLGVVDSADMHSIVSDFQPILTCHRDTGELQSVDGYMNIALEQTKEIVNGRVRRNYGDAFIRGNNGTHEFLSTNLSNGD